MPTQSQHRNESEFWAGAQVASRMVDNWPEWKRDLYKEEQATKTIEEEEKKDAVKEAV